jgi:uncharacterized protein
MAVFWIDPVYFLYVFIPAILISALVQVYLQRTYAKWSRIKNGSGLTGVQVGQQLFMKASLTAVQLQRTPGSLTDHFDPGANVVRLSESVAGGSSVADMAVTAHELGHVQQHQTGSGLMKLRNLLVPALRFSPMASYISIIMGLIFNLTGLIWIGILFFGLMVLFSVLTIPVERDASRRALRLLNDAGLITNDQDRNGAKAMLNAAALTYVAAAVTSILQLLYYIGLARRRT